MATLTRGAINAVLKEVYLPQLREQLNNEIGETYASLRKKTDRFDGKRIIWGVHVGRNGGIGARDEMDDLPSPDTQGYNMANTTPKYFYGSIAFSRPVWMTAVADRGAFVSHVDEEIKRLPIDLEVDMSRQIFNDVNGALGQASGAATGQVIPMAGATAQQMRGIWVGMRLDIGTFANPIAGAANVEVTAVNRTAKTITVVGTVTSVANSHYIRLAGSAAANRTKELTGLQRVVSTGDSIFGIDGATIPEWNSLVNSVSTKPTAETLGKTFDDVKDESGKTPNLVVTTAATWRAYLASLTDQVRYVTPQANSTMTGGTNQLAVATPEGNFGLSIDRFCPEGHIYFLNTDHLWFTQVTDWEWIDEDGSVYFRIPNKDAFGMTIAKYTDLACDRRNALAKWTNVDTTP